jgi:hypothetical protein
MGQRSVHRAALGCAGCAVSGIPRAIAKAGLALEFGAGDLTATYSAKTRAIVVIPRLIFLGAKLTDRPGIQPHESVVEYVQFADWN